MSCLALGLEQKKILQNLETKTSVLKVLKEFINTLRLENHWDDTKL